jgi:hypothetical protein
VLITLSEVKMLVYAGYGERTLNCWIVDVVYILLGGTPNFILNDFENTNTSSYPTIDAV